MQGGPYGNCKEAELHKQLEVQSYGAMLVIDKRSHTICATSENIEKFVGKPPEAVLGKPWSELLHPNQVDTLFLPATDETVTARVTRATINQRELDVSNHSLGNHTLVELEPATTSSNDLDFAERSLFLLDLAKSDTPIDAAKRLMQEVARLIDFDRVMLYRFLPGWHGEVVAEALKPGIEGFMGLRFPEGDVPANARRLFTINLQRLIADVSAPTASFSLIEGGYDIDMSYAHLRAIHPVHIKYLQNMGVAASFSLSIVCEGKLWGLIACHHLSPKVLSIRERQRCEELTRMAAMHMNDVMRTELERKRYAYRVAISEMRGSLNAQRKGFQTINAHIESIKALFHGDGVWHRLGGQDYFGGNVPDQTSLSILRNWVDRLNRNQINARHEIPKELASQPALVRFASGMLYIPLNKNDFILVLRQEQLENVTWAGKPQSIENPDDSVAALTPRSSFQKWSQELKGQSEPWHELDIESAQRLREELIDYLDRSEMEEMALKDALTGLSNRLCFERRLEEAIRYSIEHDTMFAVYMIDLDNFKPVNDGMGHAAGDALLIQVSERLSTLVRDEDTVARLGGDEFAVILSKVQSVDVVEQVAGRILAEIKRPFDIENSQVQIGASIGVSLCPMDAASQAELLREADVALYEVKKAGRNGYKRFEKGMLDDQELNESARNLLESAFEENQFELLYQPVLDTRSHALESLEAFCVWHHPEEGLVRARDFQPLIERHQLSTTWAEWGLNTLFEQYQQWQRAGLPSVPLCINLSAKQFLNLDVLGMCQELANKYQVDTAWLRIDLDEHALVASARRAEEKIAQLAEAGILVNIDHFGKGLVSLRQLTQLKLNTLKITGSLLHTDKPDQKLDAQVAIFNSISNVIDVPVVATQIESEAGIKAAKAQGICRFQGFAIAKPLTAAEVHALLLKPDEIIKT
ncbi:MAG: diguanylate cyclase [Oleiphilaceae bacterium]|nr:diguanylate cyclase [Oleiphilaceae bacterium]